jgi:hypothetical protein
MMNGSNKGARTGRWARVMRGPWTVACAVVTVVVGPAAVTASALDRANAAPPHHAYETPHTPYATLPQPLKRSHNLG